jgi:hypothetical protein
MINKACCSWKWIEVIRPRIKYRRKAFAEIREHRLGQGGHRTKLLEMAFEIKNGR